MHTRTFTTTNPEQIEYKQGVLEITILGGIKLEGLDRMRVTVKIQVEHLALRHNLDLYNDNQVEKLIRKVAAKLEVGTSVVAAALEDLTGLLEQYRIEEREKLLTEKDSRKPLTKEETKTARQYLSAPNLMSRTSKDIGKSGVVGETANRLLMYLIYTSRKRDQPLHIISLGSSGAGKTHLQEKVGELIPDEDKIQITALSENAFYYFGRRELKNKLILIEDLDGAESVLYPLRELQTKRKISKTVVHKNTRGETRTIHLKVEGPVSVAGCTTREKVYEDNANRSFLIYIDESEEQDEQIMNYQRAVSAGRVDYGTEEEIKEQMQNCQRILKPIKIINPYAEQLKIPQEVFKPRRTNNHYLQFIEAVTFYHQYQRESMVDTQTGELYIETTIEDIAAANELMKNVLIRKSDELSGACRNYFEELKGWLTENEKSSFGNREIRRALRVNHSNQKRYMIALQSCGLVKKNIGNKKQGYSYQVISTEEYKRLQQQISKVLDEVLKNIEVQSSEEVHSKNEPPNGKTVKAKQKKFTSSPK